jgi:hypothetical protein
MELFEILDNDELKCPGHRPEKKVRFRELMKGLFPEFPLKEAPTYNAFTRENNSYTIPNGKKEAVINSLLILPGKQRTVEELRIITPENISDEAAFYVTLTLHSLYERDCVDDLVDKLSRGVGILSPQLIPEERPNYGLPEVCNLNAVVKYFGFANELLERSPEFLGIKRKDVEVLRDDALNHQNAAVRNMSEERYQTELDFLGSKRHMVDPDSIGQP